MHTYYNYSDNYNYSDRATAQRAAKGIAKIAAKATFTVARMLCRVAMDPGNWWF